jgi:hypothetical protein
MGFLSQTQTLKLYVADFDEDFEACILNNVIDPTFLKSVYIQFWELEYWCRERQIPFPPFWLDAEVFGGRQVPIGGRGA